MIGVTQEVSAPVTVAVGKVWMVTETASESFSHPVSELVTFTV